MENGNKVAVSIYVFKSNGSRGRQIVSMKALKSSKCQISKQLDKKLR